jgi:hypothetical protein
MVVHSLRTSDNEHLNTINPMALIQPELPRPDFSPGGTPESSLGWSEALRAEPQVGMQSPPSPPEP